MTTEQKEAIETMQHWIEYEKQNKDKINKADELIEIQETVLNLIKEQDNKINDALNLAFEYAQIDGGHHKMWVIDQMVRKLTGNDYKEWIDTYEYDEETGDEYDWDIGIAP